MPQKGIFKLNIENVLFCLLQVPCFRCHCRSVSPVCGSSCIAMDQPIHPASLRLFLDRLLASRLGVFSLTLITVGCVIIATVSWHTALVAWPREEERFYANLEAKQPITGNETTNQSVTGNGRVNQSMVGDGTVDQSAATCP